MTPSLQRLVRSLRPGARIVSIEPLAPDRVADDPTRKATGYGVPIRIQLVGLDGAEEALVLHVESSNDFGHDRRSDRASNILLAYDDFARIPRHVQAVDVGAIDRSGALVSLKESGELYLVTTWAPGTVYADDLRRIATTGELEPLDRDRADALVDVLLEVHAERGGRPAAYRRAIRDLLGHGEGVFGIVDGYPEDVPGAPPSRLREIERRCLDWRWSLRGGADRLRRTHGDFHPFNIVFGPQGTAPTLLDASRGCWGDPADDVTCMTLNYVFFALRSPAAWTSAFGPLWRRFWARYLERTGDSGLLDVAAPFLAWRALVMASPRWYPDVSEDARDRLLTLIERALAAPRFEIDWAEELFR